MDNPCLRKVFLCAWLQAHARDTLKVASFSLQSISSVQKVLDRECFCSADERCDIELFRLPVSRFAFVMHLWSIMPFCYLRTIWTPYLVAGVCEPPGYTSRRMRRKCAVAPWSAGQCAKIARKQNVTARAVLGVCAQLGFLGLSLGLNARSF